MTREDLEALRAQVEAAEPSDSDDPGLAMRRVVCAHMAVMRASLAALEKVATLERHVRAEALAHCALARVVVDGLAIPRGAVVHVVGIQRSDSFEIVGVAVYPDGRECPRAATILSVDALEPVR